MDLDINCTVRARNTAAVIILIVCLLILYVHQNKMYKNSANPENVQLKINNNLPTSGKFNKPKCTHKVFQAHYKEWSYFPGSGSLDG